MHRLRAPRSLEAGWARGVPTPRICCVRRSGIAQRASSPFNTTSRKGHRAPSLQTRLAPWFCWSPRRHGIPAVGRRQRQLDMSSWRLHGRPETRRRRDDSGRPKAVWSGCRRILVTPHNAGVDGLRTATNTRRRGTRATKATATWPFGAHVAVVEVDTETGLVALRRIICADDCGRILPAPGRGTPPRRHRPGRRAGPLAKTSRTTPTPSRPPTPSSATR